MAPRASHRVALISWLGLGIAGIALMRHSHAVAWPLLANTLRLCLSVVGIAVPVGVILAWLLARTDIPGRRLLGIGLLTLLFVPLVVQSAAWDAAFGLQGGWTVAHTRANYGPPGMGAAVCVHSLTAIPWVVFCVGLGLRHPERGLEELASLDAPAWLAVATVSLRRAAPAMAVAIVGVVATTAGETTVTDLFQVRTAAEELFTRVQLSDSRGLREITWICLASTVWLVGAGLALGSKFAPLLRAGNARGAAWIRLGRYRWCGCALATTLIVGLCGAPLASLLYKAGVVVAQQGHDRVRYWSAVEAARVTLRSPSDFGEDIVWTLSTGLLAATAAVALAAPLAWAMRERRWLAWIAATAAAGMLATPGALLAIGLIHALSRPDPGWLAPIASLLGFEKNWGLCAWLYDQPYGGLVFVQCWRAMPWTLGILWFALRTIPAVQLDAAKLDGVSAWSRFTRIGLAQHRAALAAAWLVSLALATAELPASLLVAPPGVTTLTMQIFNRLHYGAEKEIAGICLCAWIATAAATAIVWGASLRHASRSANSSQSS